LKKSTGDIISDRVSKDAAHGFFGGNIADLAGSDKDQFTLKRVSILSRALWLLIIGAYLPIGEMRGTESTHRDGRVRACQCGIRLRP
jgi:hypothetical protein